MEGRRVSWGGVAEYPCICEMDSNLNSQHLATLLLQLKSKRAAANDGIWHGASLQTACYQLWGGELVEH